MEDGGFIWLIIFAVAVLQGIGQRKKKPGQQGRKPPGSPRPRPAQRPQPRAGPSTPRPPQASLPEGSSKEKEESSEGMIPQDIWAEILGLARGQPPQQEPKEELPKEAEPLPEVGDRRRRDSRPSHPDPDPVPAFQGAESVSLEADPAKPKARAPLSLPPSPEPESGSGLREVLFGRGSPQELRKAVILKEVLDSPLCLREE